MSDEDYRKRRAQLQADMHQHAQEVLAREAALRSVLVLGCTITLLVIVVMGAVMWGGF